MQRPAVTTLEVVAKSLPGVMVGAAILVGPRPAGQWFWAGLALLSVAVAAVYARRGRGASAHHGPVWACLLGAAGAVALAAVGPTSSSPWALAVAGLLTGLAVVAADGFERPLGVAASTVAVACGVALIGGGVDALAAARTAAGVALVALGAAVMVAVISGLIGGGAAVGLALIGLGAAVMGGTVAGLIGGDSGVFVAVTAVTVTVFVIMAVDEATAYADSVTVLVFLAAAVVAGGTGVSLLITGGVLTAVPLLMCGAVFIVIGVRWFTADQRRANESASPGRGSPGGQREWPPNRTAWDA